MPQKIFEDVRAMQELVDALPVAIFVKDAQSRFLLMNKACEAQWGMCFADLAGTDAGQFFPPEQMEWFLAKDKEIFDGARAVDFEETFWNASLKQNRVGHTFKKPVFTPTGEAQYLIGVTIDITDSRKAHQELSLSEEKLRSLFDMSPIGIARNAMDGGFIEANTAFLNIVGYSLQELNRLSYWDLTPENYAEQEARQLESLKTRAQYGPYEKEYINSKGQHVAVRLNGVQFTDSDGEKFIWSMVEDISERKAAEEKLQLAALVYQNSSEGMMITDKDNFILDINPAFTKVTGYTLDEVCGKSPNFLNSGRQDAAFYQAMFQTIKVGGHWEGEMWNRRKNGEIYAAWQSINTIFNADGSVYRHVALFSDITQKKASEEIIWKQANFDTLTGLPNRRMFYDRLAQEMKKSTRANLPLALMFIDLDRFKEVNDTLGHAQGDMLLVEAARRIKECVRASDTVARLGGDEFTVILSELDDIGSIERVAQHIISKLTRSFVLDQESVFVTASIGITLYPNDATLIEVLMKNADQAMYVAKNQGRNRFSYFTHELQETAQTRMRLTNDLRIAMAEKQFQVYYQPIVEMATGEILKAEALIRWVHPVRGMINPAQFIPLAEESGLINEIGDWVFHETARQVKQWRASHEPLFQISVNKSPVQFRQDAGASEGGWLAHLAAMSLHGQSISIEITEGLLLNADVDISGRLLEFRDAGVQISIDDFGTGYSSLAYLKKFDIDYLKIDQTFVSNLENDTDDLALCEAIIVMAHKLGLKVIAEGVETEQQRKILALAGCDFAQGYLFSRPVPANEFQVLLDKTRAGRLTAAG